MESPVYQQTDHDLLIRMDENLRNLGANVNTLSLATAGKLDDLTKRVQRLERYGSIAIGALALLQILWQAHILCGVTSCPATTTPFTINSSN